MPNRVSYWQEWRDCHNKRCKTCPHGPYWFRRRGDGRREYVGRDLPPDAGMESAAGAATTAAAAAVRRFDAAWGRTARQGLCDAFGGEEYRRVLRAWLRAGGPLPESRFIRDQSNRSARDADGKGGE